jgi:cytochrome P450
MSNRPYHHGHPVDFHWDPHNPEEANTYPSVVDEIRERCPVGWSSGRWSPTDTGFWLLTRYSDARAVGANWQLFSSAGGAAPLQFDPKVFRNGFLETDPPLHTKVREMVTPFFLQRALEVHEDGIRKIIEELIEECVKESPADWVEKYAIALPSRIFFELFLHEDPKAIGWIIDLIQRLFADAASASELVPKIQRWCATVLESRRQAGHKHDMAGVIAHMGNEPDFQLQETDRVETLALLIFAGMETTANAISAVIYTFATQPAIHARLANADANQLLKAVDEFLRFASPVPAAGRTLTADVELGGCPMKKGERVTLNWLSANRDPGVYSDPDKLDLDRNASQHLAFGIGHHKCLGMHLAKRELRLTIEALAKLSVFRLVPGSEVNYRNGPARGLTSLKVICAR